MKGLCSLVLWSRRHSGLLGRASQRSGLVGVSQHCVWVLQVLKLVDSDFVRGQKWRVFATWSAPFATLCLSRRPSGTTSLKRVMWSSILVMWRHQRPPPGLTVRICWSSHPESFHHSLTHHGPSGALLPHQAALSYYWTCGYKSQQVEWLGRAPVFHKILFFGRFLSQNPDLLNIRLH